MKKLLLIGLIGFLGISTAGAQQRIEWKGKSENKIDVARLSAIPSGAMVQSLNGKWSFSPVKGGKVQKPIEVPGEWVMQGFSVKTGEWAEYNHQFTIPGSWKGKRVKLRFSAVFSEAEVYVNGSKQGYHLGGFTPFELDVTNIAKAGSSNSIKVLVKSESAADSLASASQYAVHPLGGITRDVKIFALPEVNLGLFHVSTELDKEYKNATLKSEVEVENESSAVLKGIKVQMDLCSKGNGKVITSKVFNLEDEIAAGSSLQKVLSMDVVNPMKWDPEHPNLYQVKLTITPKGGKAVTYFKNVGFRQVEVKGNQVLVNGSPIKLRGVCRHEVMPLRGRSLTGDQWAEDVRIFREGNVNYIRTSHYPPDERLAVACDSLGMFLEVEAPFCWAENTKVTAENRKATLESQTLDMVNTFKSHPSVIIWSIGNESGYYKDYFSNTAKMVKDFDPTRPRNFSQYGPKGDDEELEIGNHHYPGVTGPDTYRNSKRPIVFDEYCHLNAYNRRELYTDPEVRDAWGVGLSLMWDNMYRSKGVLGGALWAAIDDTFFLPDGKTVGYGTWGPIDGWRREKPEFWHMKKAYSPVRLVMNEIKEVNGKYEVAFSIENRNLFSDLSECRFEWIVGDAKGTFAVSGKPRETGNASATISGSGKSPLIVNVYDARGVLCDTYSYTLSSDMVMLNESSTLAPLSYSESNGLLTVKSGSVEMKVSLSNGTISTLSKNGATLLSGNAELMIQRTTNEGYGTQMTGEKHVWEPLNSTCTGQTVKKVVMQKGSSEFTLAVTNEYNEAYGTITYSLNKEGKLEIAYSYILKININPRQWGVVLSIPSAFSKLKWSKFGQWNYYPEDHIGRLEGEAAAVNSQPLSGPAGPEAKPTGAWKDDRNELGTNDFRSTKTRIKEYLLTDGNSQVKVIGDGTQSARAWIEKTSNKLMVSGFSNHGAEGFFRSHAEKFDKPLRIGDKISDTVTIEF